MEREREDDGERRGGERNGDGEGERWGKEAKEGERERHQI